MDQRLLKCESPDDVLTLLTTHRGVLFVHNLVTAVTTLSQMTQEHIPFSKAQKFKDPDQLERVERDRLLSDARYVLLIRDLREFAPQLDLKSIETIMSAMRSLDHCDFKLFGALLKRVYSIDLGYTDIATAVSIGQVFEWAGFGKAETFYKRLSDLVEKGAKGLSTRDMMNSLIMFSRLGKLYPSVMHALVEIIPDRFQALRETDIGIAAIAASEFGEVISVSPVAVGKMAEELLKRSSEFESAHLRAWIRVGISLRRVNVMHENFLRVLWSRSMNELSACAHQRERMDPSVSSISDLGMMVESCAYFGEGSACDIREIILPHVLDNIDIVTEETAIRIMFGVSMFSASVSAVSAPTVSLLIRKIASATDSWEKHKLKLFSIWITKIMQFDFVSSEFRKLVIDSSLSHYLIARRGYGIPYPEDSRALFEAMQEASAADLQDKEPFQMLFNEWIPNSPFNADILIPDLRVAILVLSRFSSDGKPVGTDLMQIRNIESLGWKAVPIDRKILRSNLFSDVRDSLLTQLVK